jgi:CRP-like cAMP-binding protein
MSKDARALREEAAEATATGKYKRALAAYLELERLEPRDAQWAKRAGETYRRLGNHKNAIEAFNRSAERYAQNGFLVQAIAVCKLVLQIDPQHVDTLRRLATMNEQIGQVPTRAGTMAENNPALHDSPTVAAIRNSSTLPAEARPRRSSEPLDRLRSKPGSTPGIVMPRTRSKPVAVSHGAALESVSLHDEFPDARRDESNAGIHIIPIDDDDATGEFRIAAPRPGSRTVRDIDPEDLDAEVDLYADADGDRGGLVIEIEPPDDSPDDPEALDQTVLEVGDIEEIPLPAPRAIGFAAQQALAATPLFAGLPSDALEALVEQLSLVSLDAGSALFNEGDPNDALYVIVEGELSVQPAGTPADEVQLLGPGAFIGEVALLTDQPQGATVVAVETSELLRIDRGTLATVLGEHGDLLRAVLRFVRDRLVDRWMRTSPLFGSLDEGERAELAGRFVFLEIEEGTKLIGAGMRPDGLYIVLAGRFIVHRGSRLVANLGPGDLIGETALLAGGAFKSDVIAHGKALALCLPAAVFREVIMTHPHVLAYIGEQAEHSRRLQIL